MDCFDFKEIWIFTLHIYSNSTTYMNVNKNIDNHKKNQSDLKFLKNIFTELK